MPTRQPKRPFWLVRKYAHCRLVLVECATAETAKRVQAREARLNPGFKTKIVRVA